MSAEPASTDPAPADLAAIAARITCPVVLVGLMGVGKSTVGRKLASLLRRDFVDADEAIVEAAQLSIPEIFEQFGEPYFRDGERRVIARLIEEGHGVIATGGGAFVDPSTRALILERLRGRISREGQITCSSDAHRSQGRNIEEARALLAALLARALHVQKERKETKPSRSQRARRLNEKRERGALQAERRGGGWE